MAAAAQEAETSTDTPKPTLAELKARYKNVREPVVTALHLLLQHPNISVDDAKARAKELGTRITAASVAAAQRLLERMDTAPAASTAPVAPTTPTRPARRPRAAESTADAEALIKGVVAKLQSQGNAEAEKLRASIRRAVELLTAALA